MAQPTKLPEWNTGGLNRSEPSSGTKAVGHAVDSIPSSAEENWWKHTVYDYIRYLFTEAGGHFGDASDGNFTTSGADVANGDKNFNILTVQNGDSYNTAGYVIRARLIVIEAGGRLHCDGTAGNPNSGSTGGSGPAGPPQSHRYLGGGDGGAGGDNDQNGSSGENLAFAFGGAGGDGGDGAGGYTGGSGGTVSLDPIGGNPFVIPRSLPDVLGPLHGSDGSWYRPGGGGGGGGGAGEGTAAVLDGGGSGGTGAGVCCLVANEIQNDGVCSVDGGAGAASGTGSGGGGGGGGFGVAAALKVTGSGTFTAAGGAAGLGGGGNGSAGSAGVWVFPFGNGGAYGW